MDAIWLLESGTVNDVLEAIPKSRRPAYNSVLTIMRILEQKGYLRREKVGRAHVYIPCVSQRQARSKAVRHMVTSLFDNSPGQLMLNILEDESLSADDIKQLKQMINKRG
ncbi:MAG: BlaI/MecI/CopY family transcriptional regulator [bacterium]|nr:BlaI/MecI/CopY family transcriptional regulator [bacterium]